LSHHWKAFVKCPIFVFLMTSDMMSSPVQCWAKFSNFLVGWSISRW